MANSIYSAHSQTDLGVPFVQEGHTRCFQESSAGSHPDHALHGGGGGRVWPCSYHGVRPAEVSTQSCVAFCEETFAQRTDTCIIVFVQQMYWLHPAFKGEIRSWLQFGGQTPRGADRPPAGGAVAQGDPPNLPSCCPAGEVRPSLVVDNKHVSFCRNFTNSTFTFTFVATLQILLLLLYSHKNMHITCTDMSWAKNVKCYVLLIRVKREVKNLSFSLESEMWKVPFKIRALLKPQMIFSAALLLWWSTRSPWRMSNHWPRLSLS